jgi:hypothetical protein
MEAQPRRPGAAQDLRAAEAGCTPAQSEKVVTLVLISCPCLVASGVCAPALPRRSASHFFSFSTARFHPNQSVAERISRPALTSYRFLSLRLGVGLIDASSVLELHCGRNPPATGSRFQPGRNAKVET